MKVFVFLCVVGAAFAVREPVVHTCLDRPDSGMCLAYFPMYYYDAETGTCKEFIYGGCQGNGNRYGTEEECLKHCEGVRVEQSSSDVCSLKKEPGMCLGYFPRYYYDQEAGECKRFIYGGCQGNGNNFNSIEECQSTCTPETQAALDRPDCDKPAETGECRAYIPRYYYDQEAGMCKKFIYGGCGGNRNNFKSEDECYNKCGALMGATACQQDKEVGPCKAAFRRYFYNKETGQCELFIYGGCAGNDNNFNSKDDCEAVCLPQSAVDRCSQEPETGLCRGYFPLYYFDKTSGTCKKFIYGGCGGNENRFQTEEDCLDACSA